MISSRLRAGRVAVVGGLHVRGEHPPQSRNASQERDGDSLTLGLIVLLASAGIDAAPTRASCNRFPFLIPRDAGRRKG